MLSINHLNRHKYRHMTRHRPVTKARSVNGYEATRIIIWKSGTQETESDFSGVGDFGFSTFSSAILDSQEIRVCEGRMLRA